MTPGALMRTKFAVYMYETEACWVKMGTRNSTIKQGELVVILRISENRLRKLIANIITTGCKTGWIYLDTVSRGRMLDVI